MRFHDRRSEWVGKLQPAGCMHTCSMLVFFYLLIFLIYEQMLGLSIVSERHFFLFPCFRLSSGFPVNAPVLPPTSTTRHVLQPQAQAQQGHWMLSNTDVSSVLSKPSRFSYILCWYWNLTDLINCFHLMIWLFTISAVIN